MFKRLYVEQSIEGMTENSKEFSATIREDVGNFQQRQIDRYGVLNKKIDFNPISNWVPFVKKKSSIYGVHAIFPNGCGFIVSNNLLRIINEINFPHHQIWETKVSMKKVTYDFYLLYFYYDYVQKVDFSKTKFELIVPKLVEAKRYDRSSYRAEIVDDNFKFNSFKSYQDWLITNRYNSQVHYYEQPSVRFSTIVFLEEVYSLDIINSTWLGFDHMISEKLETILLQHIPSEIVMSDCGLPISYNTDLD